jgi:hypothetical protein
MRAHHALACIPAAALLAAPWVADRPTRLLGVPFLLAWTVGAVLLTSATMWFIHRLDVARLAESDAAEGSASEGDA